MNDQHDDDDAELTVELPAELTTRLKKLRAKFGDEIVIDLLQKALAKIDGQLALRGTLPDKHDH